MEAEIENASPVNNPDVEEKPHDIYASWREHVRECMEEPISSSSSSSSLHSILSKENLDGNLQEKKQKSVRFAESPKNKPTLLKRKNIVPESVVLASPTTSR